MPSRDEAKRAGAGTAKTLLEYLRTHKPGPFKPSVFFNEAGQQVHCTWEDEQSYAEERDGFKVLIGMETGRVTGVVIYGAVKA